MMFTNGGVCLCLYECLCLCMNVCVYMCDVCACVWEREVMYECVCVCEGVRVCVYVLMYVWMCGCKDFCFDVWSMNEWISEL